MTIVPNETEQALNRQYDVYAAARDEYRKKIAEQAAEITRLRSALRDLLNASERHIFSTECQQERDAALARRGAAMQWRPIEEAPKDGTEFIAYRPDAGVFTASYDDEQDAWFANHGYEDITDDLPTHWMPLPPPPKGAEE